VTPNECLANEVNFRLLEAASAGSLVLGPDVGPDQNELLEPGKEFLLYHDGLELLELAAWTKARPVETERMARAAWLRAQTGHLCAHRVAFLLARFSSCARNRLDGPAAALALWLALARQIRNRVLPLDGMAHAAEGLRLVRDLTNASSPPAFPRPLLINTLAQVLLLFAEGAGGTSSPERAFLLCRDLAQGRLWGRAEEGASFRAEEECLPVLAAASAFALSRRDFSMARAFWVRFAGKGKDRLPRSPVELCIAWSAAFRRGNGIYDAGFGFDPEEGFLPENALSWLLFARHLQPGRSVDILGRCTSLLAGTPSLLYLYMGHLAELSLADQDNWRVQQEYGLACLKSYRVREALGEIREARDKARNAGKDRLFFSRLCAWGPKGRLWEKVLGN
jgi:hypothetical protein